MVRKSYVTEQTEKLTVYSMLKSGADILAKRADRMVKPLATEVYDRLYDGQKISQGFGVQADYRFESTQKARTLKEGIREYSKRFPEEGEKLKEIIAQTKESKARHLNYGISRELPTEVYITAMESIGIPRNMQEGLLENILKISDMFSKKTDEGLFEILVK